MVIPAEELAAVILVICFATWWWGFEYQQKSSMTKFLVQVGVSHILSAILVAAELLLVVPLLLGVTWADVALPPPRVRSAPVMIGIFLARFIGSLYGFRSRRKMVRACDAANSPVGVDEDTKPTITSDKDADNQRS